MCDGEAVHSLPHGGEEAYGVFEAATPVQELQELDVEATADFGPGLKDVEKPHVRSVPTSKEVPELQGTSDAATLVWSAQEDESAHPLVDSQVVRVIQAGIHHGLVVFIFPPLVASYRQRGLG